MTAGEPAIPADPCFGVLDIVEIDDEPRWRGVVTAVTRHPDRGIMYSVRQLTDDPDYMAGKYPQACLTAMGETAPAAMFALPGGWREGDMVEVAAGCGHAEYAGKTAVVDGSSSPDGAVGVWIEDLGEGAAFQPEFLIRTGKRHPRPAFTPHETSCTSVSQDGVITGRSRYVILDGLDNYLSDPGL
jgi:hypothetical protein